MSKTSVEKSNLVNTHNEPTTETTQKNHTPES